MEQATTQVINLLLEVLTLYGFLGSLGALFFGPFCTNHIKAIHKVIHKSKNKFIKMLAHEHEVAPVLLKTISATLTFWFSKTMLLIGYPESDPNGLLMLASFVAVAQFTLIELLFAYVVNKKGGSGYVKIVAKNIYIPEENKKLRDYAAATVFGYAGKDKRVIKDEQETEYDVDPTVRIERRDEK